ncbi:MAG: hypothetical protein P8J78_05220 [Maricaulis sp.]|jgi:hypothetical protein|nr:hypothetical protein [Maricaulis sp.]MDG2043990.1 hypothetical protein [Maricaulis sp.]
MLSSIRNLVEHWAFDPLFEFVMAGIVAMIGFLISLGIRRGRKRRSLSRFLLRLARQASLAASTSLHAKTVSARAKVLEQREYYFFLFLLERVEHRISSTHETDTDGYDAELIPIRDAALALSKSFDDDQSRSGNFSHHYNAFLEAILGVGRKTGVLPHKARREISGLMRK